MSKLGASLLPCIAGAIALAAPTSEVSADDGVASAAARAAADTEGTIGLFNNVICLPSASPTQHCDVDFRAPATASEKPAPTAEALSLFGLRLCSADAGDDACDVRLPGLQRGASPATDRPGFRAWEAFGLKFCFGHDLGDPGCDVHVPPTSADEPSERRAGL